MADNKIEFTVSVKDEGLAPLATALDQVEGKADELGKTAAATGQQLDGMGKVDGLAPLAGALDQVEGKADELAQGAKQAASGLGDLSAGAVAAGGKAGELAQGAGQAATQLGRMGADAASAAQPTDELGRSAERSAEGMDAARKAATEKAAAIKSGLDVTRSEIELARRTLDLQRTQQQGLLQLARARGDDAAAMKAANQLQQIEVQQLALAARSKREEAAAVQATADARREALGALGPLTQAQQRELQAAENTAKALRTEAAAADEAARQVGQLGTELGNAADQGPRLDAALSAVGKAVAGLFALDKAKDFALSTIALADAYGQMAERIGMATPIASEYERVQQRILETANLTYRPLAEQQELYIRTADALRSMAYNTEEVLDITDSFSYLLTTNAATVERGQNAIDAYTKSIQSGRIEVDAWQSIMAATPTIVDAVATATGKTTAEVRQLGITGKLAINDLNEGLRQTVELNKQAAAGMSATVGDAITRLKNNWTQYIGEANQANQSTAKIAAAIDVLSDNLDTVVKLAITAGEVMAVAWGIKALGALKAYTAQLVVASAQTTALMATTAAAGDKAAAGLLAAGKLAASGWMGWEIGTFLKDEFEEVEKAGIAMAAGLTRAAAQYQAAWEIAKAVFTDDTIEAAQQRLAQRIQEIDAEYEALFANVGAGAPKLAADTKAVGDAAADAASKVRLSATDMVEAWEAARVAKVGDAQAAEANLRVQLQLAQQSEAMARFMGNETEVRKAKILQMRIEIELVNAKVAVQRAEAEGSIAVAQAKLDEMKVNKEVNLVKQAELETAIKLARAKLAEADATGKSTLLLEKQLELIRNSTSATDADTRSVNANAQARQAAAEAARGVGDAIDQEYAARLRNSFAIDEENRKLKEQAERKRLNMDAERFSTDRNGTRIVQAVDNQASAASKLQAMGVDPEKAKQLAARVYDERGNYTPRSSGFFRAPTDTLDDVLSRMAEAEKNAVRIAATPSPGAPSSAAPLGTTHTVTINIGGRSANIRTASAQDSDALAEVLRQLERAAGRA